MHSLGWYIGPVCQASIGTNTWPMGDIYLLPSSVLMFSLYGWNKSMLGIQNNWGVGLYMQATGKECKNILALGFGDMQLHLLPSSVLVFVISMAEMRICMLGIQSI